MGRQLAQYCLMVTWPRLPDDVAGGGGEEELDHPLPHSLVDGPRSEGPAQNQHCILTQ